MSTIFVCGTVESGLQGDTCWWCESPLDDVKREHGEPFKADDRFGRYCSIVCADDAAAHAAEGDTRCTVCMQSKGRCSTHPEDPHEYEPIGAT